MGQYALVTWTPAIRTVPTAMRPHFALLLACSACLPSWAQERIEFSRDIQPLLSDKCYKCHGPDKAQRKTELRLDLEKSAYSEIDGNRAIVPGSLSKSDLYRRITSNDELTQMPPADSGLQLSKEQIGLIRRWIEQGAPWEKHWSFQTPRRPAIPSISNSSECINEIDYFVHRQLERQKGPTATSEAGRTTLIRRLTLDLTGLPPTPAEVDAFLRDTKPGGYERLVDRLLASPRYGERMANRWLDAARYADTSGYQNDGPRYMWRWRDWVIQSLNDNMPFDQFTVEQLAGDLLPRATLDQRIATGFNRNHRGNAEGGIIPEEYAVEYVVDRVDTTATVWLGLTMGCARCHDHKYDPISQQDFYRVFAYFNNVPEYGRAIKEGNSPPFIKAPTRYQRGQYTRLNRRLDQARQVWRGMRRQVNQQQRKWEVSLNSEQPIEWTVADGLLAHFPLDKNNQERVSQSKAEKYDSYAPGRLSSAADLDGKTSGRWRRRRQAGVLRQIQLLVVDQPIRRYRYAVVADDQGTSWQGVLRSSGEWQDPGQSRQPLVGRRPSCRIRQLDSSQ